VGVLLSAWVGVFGQAMAGAGEYIVGGRFWTSCPDFLCIWRERDVDIVMRRLRRKRDVRIRE
jgi:hypothetical protein